MSILQNMKNIWRYLNRSQTAKGAIIMNHDNKGFGVIEIILIVAATAVIGFVGWKAWDTFSNNKTADTAQTQQINTDQSPAVTDNSGLDKSTATLDAVNVDGTESAQLSSETNF
jgi:Tfp pilus assembly protein PilE